MAINNPRGNYNFLLQINNIVMARVQMVTPPTKEMVVHRQGNSGNKADKKTPGKEMIGELVIELVVPDTGDAELWNAIESCKTELRAAYAGVGIISELGPGGTPVSNFFLGDVWVSKVETANYETTEGNSDNLKRTVTFQVEEYRLI